MDVVLYRDWTGSLYRQPTACGECLSSALVHTADRRSHSVDPGGPENSQSGHQPRRRQRDHRAYLQRNHRAGSPLAHQPHGNRDGSVRNSYTDARVYRSHRIDCSENVRRLYSGWLSAAVLRTDARRLGLPAIDGDRLRLECS